MYLRGETRGNVIAVGTKQMKNYPAECSARVQYIAILYFTVARQNECI